MLTAIKLDLYGARQTEALLIYIFLQDPPSPRTATQIKKKIVPLVFLVLPPETLLSPSSSRCELSDNIFQKAAWLSRMQQSLGPAAVVRLISAPLPPLVRFIIFVLEQDSKHVSLSGQIGTSSASKEGRKKKTKTAFHRRKRRQAAWQEPAPVSSNGFFTGRRYITHLVFLYLLCFEGASTPLFMWTLIHNTCCMIIQHKLKTLL